MAPNQPRARDSCHASVFLAPHLGSIPFLSLCCDQQTTQLLPVLFRSHSLQGAALRQRETAAPRCLDVSTVHSSIHARCRSTSLAPVNRAALRVIAVAASSQIVVDEFRTGRETETAPLRWTDSPKQGLQDGIILHHISSTRPYV